MDQQGTSEIEDLRETEDSEASSFTANESKVDLLQKVLGENLYGCDILLCLFLTALQSFRVDRCLRPFPAMYIKNFNKDVDTLRRICETIPPLKSIYQNPHKCSSELLQLLVWLFCQKDQPVLRRISYNEVNVPSQLKKSLIPNYTYLVVYPERTETIWQTRKGSRKSFLCYHGSQLHNFYSIFKVGLQQSLEAGKQLLYGAGIYLTTEIILSMTYAPFAHSWKNSSLGNRQSIIAVCEVIDDIDKVKCQDAKFKKRAINQGSISGKIPEKYFVVTDSDMLRLKYLFVYTESTVSTMKSWVNSNMAILLVCLYVIILFSIGAYQSPTSARQLKRLYRMFQ